MSLMCLVGLFIGSHIKLDVSNLLGKICLCLQHHIRYLFHLLTSLDEFLFQGHCSINLGLKVYFHGVDLLMRSLKLLGVIVIN